jgi:hypothetical protein
MEYVASVDRTSLAKLENSPEDSIVKLVVGSTELISLNVHRGNLCKSSEYFKNSMKPEWASMRDDPHTIDLGDDSVSTVKAYIQWLYTDNIPMDLDDILSNRDGKQRAQEAEKAYVQLAEAYVYGEKILDTKYKNRVVETIIKAINESNWSMGSESVGIIYAGTPSGSPLRRLVADQVAYVAHDDSEDDVGWMTFFDEYPREALLDALKAMSRVRDAVERDFNSREIIESYLDKEGK